jgi:adenylate kinase
VKAIVLIGSPGSGKGTQARMLTQCFHVPHISTGDMLRDRIRHGGNEMGTCVVATMQSGALVSDRVVNEMVKERLSEPDATRGFVLDGYPRTLDQAEHLGEWLSSRGVREVVIHLAVDYNIIIARLTGRRECPCCGTLYNVAFHPPKVDELCDKEGCKLVIRDDDRESVIRERLDAYDRQTLPLLAYYKNAGRKVVRVDGSIDPPDTVFQRIRQALEQDDSSKNGR